MENLLVSIIMPVYNSELYIKDAILSILSQSYKNIELIIIDDGSVDSSGKICDEIKNIDNRVRVYHIENRGVNYARNLGIAYSKGDYICFCDNDDTFDTDFIYDNIELAEKYKVDIVRFYRRQVVISSEEKIIKKTESPNGNILVFKEIGMDIQQFFDFLISSNSLGIWNALYKSKLIKQHDVKFDLRLSDWSEDCCFNFDYYKYISSAVVNQKTYYNWNLRPFHSMSFDVSQDALMKRCYALKILIEKENLVLQNYKNQDISKVVTYNTIRAVSYLDRVLRDIPYEKEYVVRCWQEIAYALSLGNIVISLKLYKKDDRTSTILKLLSKERYDEVYFFNKNRNVL